MSKAMRGTKRHCRSCGAKFYDLGRDPIICPICQTVYELEASSSKAAPPPRPAAAAAPAPAPAAAEEESTSEEAGPEVISLEDADAETGSASAAEEEEESIPDLGEVQEDIPQDDNEDVFLEDEGEEQSDVSGFIGGPPGDDEEP